MVGVEPIESMDEMVTETAGERRKRRRREEARSHAMAAGVLAVLSMFLARRGGLWKADKEARQRKAGNERAGAAPIRSHATSQLI